MAYQHLLKVAAHALKDATHNFITEEKLEAVEKTIQTCSILAAATGVGASLFPGGALVMSAASVAAIWGMYIKINKDLGISISDNKLKSLASAMLTNLIAGAGAYLAGLAAALVLGFIPGLHTIAIPIQAMIAYIAVFASGVLYIKFLTKLFKAQGGFEIDDDDQMDSVIKDVIRDTDMKSLIDECKDSYKKDKKDGNVK